MFDPKATGFEDPILISSTDGVGTKVKLASAMDKHDTIGIDLVAMCVNDIIVQGAKPLFFLDYYAMSKLMNDVAEVIIAGIAEGCQMAGCALIGGETAEMPGHYAPGDYDLAGFSVGAVERDQVITGQSIVAGDVILGLSSNGVHSNGFSLVRKLIDSTQGFDLDTPSPFGDGLCLGEALLTPTRIYVSAILKALELKDDQGRPAIKGMAHITGGGLLENLPRILPEGLKSCIDVSAWELPPLFRWLCEIGKLSTNDMGTTLNCGIGYTVICSPEHADEMKTILEAEGERVFNLGTVQTANAGDELVALENVEGAWPVSED